MQQMTSKSIVIVISLHQHVHRSMVVLYSQLMIGERYLTLPEHSKLPLVDYIYHIFHFYMLSRLLLTCQEQAIKLSNL